VGITPNEAPYMGKDSTPFSVFMLYSSEIIHLLVEGMNQYYHQYLERPSPIPDITDSEMFLFTGIIVQMGHDIRDRLRD
jgi:hypothetical protein